MAGAVGACASKVKLDPFNPDGKDDSLEKDGILNGTKIADFNNIYGLIRDTDGNPVENVTVTDGYRFSSTDENGVYQMMADPRSKYLYYSLPSGYAIIQDSASHLPLFFQELDPNAAKDRKDFTLVKLAAASSAFSFAVLGDIHVRDAATGNKFKSGAMKQIGEYFKENPSAGPAFGVALGDIINNAKDPETFNYTREALGSAALDSGKYLPFYAVIGNHDHNARLGDSSKTGTDGYDAGTDGNFTATFGPTCYSFNVGKVHFVALDNYIARAAPSSSSTALASSGQSGLSDDVYKWLVKDLSFVRNKEDKMVVILQHCHIRGFAEIPHREDMLSELSAFNSAYILSGHAHICESYKYKVTTKNGNPVIEKIHGVPMGNFWYSRYNPDGAPAGFYIYNVKGNDFSSWEYRPLHDPSDKMRVYDSNDVYDKETDWSRQYAWSKEPLFAGGNFILAHIYSGDEDWEVTLEHDGKSEKMTFANKRIYDYCVNCHLANDNVSGIKTSWKYHWDYSENWWYLKLDRPASELTDWKIVAKAKFPGSSETRTYTCNKITKSVSE